MTDFFLADTHFGSSYRTYAKPRGFVSVEAMHEAIVSAWCSRVTDQDTVWVLGDVGDFRVLADLPGTKHLIFGNADDRKAAIESGVFAERWTKHLLETDMGPILLIHDPKHASREGGRVLHGHTHAKPPQADPRFICVSIDQTGWGPISLEEVMQRFEARKASA